MDFKRITVFCASSRIIDKKYMKATKELAEILVQNNITTIYGGGSEGLMGELANTVLNLSGDIEGVIPSFMIKMKWEHPKIKKMIVTKNMHERKKLLLKKTDAVVALPGGVGTLEELLEVICHKQLGKFLKPIIIINTNGYFNYLINFFNQMVKEKFLHMDHLDIWQVIDHPKELISALNNSLKWNTNAILSAQIK